MPFYLGQTIWAKYPGHGYHHVTIIIEINNGEIFLVRWRKGTGVLVLLGQEMVAVDAEVMEQELEDTKHKIYQARVA
eukprot:11165565-Ditylum_brightwellii.AAC.1